MEVTTWINRKSIQEKGIYYFITPDPLTIPMIFIILSCPEKAHENKEFSHENSKPRHELQITTCEVKPWLIINMSWKHKIEWKCKYCGFFLHKLWTYFIQTKQTK